MTIRKIEKTIKAFEFLKNIKAQEKKVTLNSVFKESNLLSAHEAEKNSVLKKIASAEAVLINDVGGGGISISGYQEKLDYIFSLDEDKLLLNELIEKKELSLAFLKLEAQLKIGQCDVISEKIEYQKKELIKKIEIKYTIDCT